MPALRIPFAAATLALLSLLSSADRLNAADDSGKTKKILFIAGSPSHGYGSHEHYAGCRVLAQGLQDQGFPVETTVVQNGWPSDESVFDGVDAIVIYADGGGRHPAVANIAQMQQLMERGVGLVCLHYAVEVPKGEPGQKFLQWLGGYFETDWSVNPHWDAQLQPNSNHPISASIKPFVANDEWYFHMRFADAEITPILQAVPPQSTMERPDGPHSGNPHVRAAVAAGKPQTLAWAFERPSGGRSFGFTGGHYHWNWGRTELLSLVTNAIAWSAGCDLPAKKSPQPPSAEQLSTGQDEPLPKDLDIEKIKREYKISAASGKDSAHSQASKTAAAQGTLIYRSPLVTANTSRHRVDIDMPLKSPERLFLLVTDGGNSYSCDWADWIDPVVVDQQGKRHSLVDLPWTQATSGYGKVRKNANCEGGALMIRDEEFPRGIGTHANSLIEIPLPPDCVRVETTAGLDARGTQQHEGRETSVRFSIYADGVPANWQGSDVDESDQRLPENAVAGLTVHPGVAVELAASEPTLSSLTNIDVDHRGRVWACEVVNYRSHNGERPEGDRVLILEDTDHDGLMDTSKVFYQGRDIDSALGICVLGNRVLVSAAPYVWEFIDEDGDDVPDRKTAILTETGQPQHDHSVHSFVYGPDNRLYFNFGNTGKQLKDRHGQPILDPQGRPINDSGRPYRQGMAFRCELDLSGMEVVGHNFRNNYELAVDSYGTIWQSDNDDDGNRATRINYVMEYGQFGYTDEMTGDAWRKPRTNLEAEIPLQHWHLNDPGVVPTMLITGAGSPTGIIAYEGQALPKPFQGTVIHCDAGPNVVRAYPTSVDGAGYQAEIVNLVEGTMDKWFRPADLCAAPDGSLFISDWYDPGVGGHRMEDTARGRLLRVAVDTGKYRFDEFSLGTMEDALKHLTSPNQDRRYLAIQKILGDIDGAAAGLKKYLQGGDPVLAARALWILASDPDHRKTAIDFAISHDDPNLRIAAIRAARRGDMAIDQLWNRLIDDGSAAVRRELAIWLHNDESQDMPRRWTQLANQYQGDDRWMLEALGIAADGRWDECLATYLADREISGDNPALVDLIWRSRAQQTAGLLTQLLTQKQLGSQDVDRLLRALDFQDRQQQQRALRELLQDLSRQQSAGEKRSEVYVAELDRQRSDRLIVEALMRLDDRSALKQDEIASAVTRHVRQLDSPAEQLAILKTLDTADADLLLEIARTSHDMSTAVAAVDLLLKSKHAGQLSAVISGSDRAAATRVVSAIALSNRGDTRRLLIAAINGYADDPNIVLAAAAGLARSQEGAAWLLDQAEAKKLPATAVAMLASSLRHHSDKTIAARADRVLPAVPETAIDLPPMAELLSKRGNASAGERLFGTTGTCSSCHQVRGGGKNVGPDLSEIGDKLTREAMLLAILNPSAGISHNYEQFAAMTADGDIVSGLLINKNEDQVILKDKDGIERTFASEDIEEMKRLETSLMPAGLEKLLGANGLVDVIEYMTTLKKAGEQ